MTSHLTYHVSQARIDDLLRQAAEQRVANHKIESRRAPRRYALLRLRLGVEPYRRGLSRA